MLGPAKWKRNLGAQFLYLMLHRLKDLFALSLNRVADYSEQTLLSAAEFCAGKDYQVKKIPALAVLYQDMVQGQWV